ncbi:MAG TPA: LacI family DNA-binding transcriptional regulator, partial [Steroidobacteraceae bacterium]|nr:LacI family DNA-binding transcriptional regulator [Steroidobacteraceae bacterium]
MTNKKAARGGSQRAPTISDVARAAGVSTMTVSRVINRAGNVKARTEAAVDAAIASLNYLPNPAARSLAGAHQMRIGLLYSNPSAYLSEFLIGVLEQANLSHVQLIVEKCAAGTDDVSVARRLASDGIDGVLLPPPLCDSAALLAQLKEAGTPVVVVAAGRPAADVSAVTIDDYAAARAMTLHLLDLGHTRIGFIAGSPDQTVSSRRQQGYAAALAEHGIAIDPARIAQGMFTYRSGLEAAERLLSLSEPPTAIFASNDDMAAATVAVAHRRGLAVPRDLTVCGFDDTAMATTIWPELTTVRQPIGEMSRAALELLVRRI